MLNGCVVDGLFRAPTSIIVPNRAPQNSHRHAPKRGPTGGQKSIAAASGQLFNPFRYGLNSCNTCAWQIQHTEPVHTYMYILYVAIYERTICTVHIDIGT